MATLPDDAAKVIRNVNASDEAIEDQCLRARQAHRHRRSQYSRC